MSIDALLYANPGGGLNIEIVAAAVAIYALAAVKDRLAGAVDVARDVLAGPEPSAIEQLQAEYENGEIDLQEFERRADLALDDRASFVAGQLKDVENVGPERAAAVAEEFGNIEAVRRASADEIENVHGVGPSTAEAISREI